MPTRDKIDQLYDALKADGAVHKSREYFRSQMLAPGEQGYKNRKQLYEALKADGAVSSATYGEFSRRLGLHAVNPKQSASQPQVSPAASLPDTEELAPSSLEVKQPIMAQRVTPMRGDELEKRRIFGQSSSDEEKARVTGPGEVQLGAEYQFKEEPYAATIGRAKNTVQSARERLKNLAGYSQGKQESMFGPKVKIGAGQEKPVTIGKSKNVVRGEDVYDEQSGEIKPTYITEAGNRYDNEALAQGEQMVTDEVKDAYSTEGQLRRLYAERDRLKRRQDERALELEKEQNDGPWYKRILRSMSRSMDDRNDLTGEWRDDEEYNQLAAALRKNQSSITTLEDAKNQETDSFWHSFGNELTNGYHFRMGQAEADDMRALTFAKGRLNEINRKREAGEELTREEQSAEAVLRNFEWDHYIQGLYGNQYGSWARAGRTSAGSVDFMLELGLMGGLPMSLAKGVARGLGKMAVKAYAKATATKLGEQLLGNVGVRTLGKFMTKVTGVTAGSLVAGAEVSNTVGLQRTVADIGQRQLGEVLKDENGRYVIGHLEDDGNGGQKIVEGGDTLMDAVIGAERQAISENGSEMLGVFMPGGKSIIKGLKGIGLSKVAGKLTRIGESGFYKNYSAGLQRMGFNGIPEEILEEYGGTGLDALMGGDEWKNLADRRTHIDIALGCITTGALLNAPRYAGMGVAAYKYNRYKHATDKADRTASFRLTPEVWQPLKEQIDNATNDQISDVVNDILGKEGMTTQEAQAVVDYVKNLQGMRGWSLGMMQSQDGQTDEAAEVDHNYTIGYNVTREEDKKKITEDMEKARAEVWEFATDDMVTQLGSDPITALNAIRSNEAWSEEEKRKALDFVNAKVAYDGMMNRQDDDKDLAIHESDMRIDRQTYKEDQGGDGKIHPAMMKDNTPVYIIGGNVVMTDDGTVVDEENSDKAILIADESGKVSYTSPEKILRVEASVDAEAKRQAAEEEIRSASDYKLNQRIVIHTADGDIGAQIVDEANEDGLITVQTDKAVNGKRVQQFTREQLDGMTRETSDTAAADDTGKKVNEYTPYTEITIRDADGTEKPAMVVGRVREENGNYVLDDNGDIIAYVMDGERKFAPESEFSGMIVNRTAADDTAQGNNDTENIPQTPVEDVTENETASEEEQDDADAMPMVKVNGKMRPDYMAAPVERTRRHIYEEKGLSREEGDAFVQANIDATAKELDRREKKAPVMGTDIDDYLERKQAWQAEVDALQRQKEYWESVKKEQDKTTGMNFFAGQEKVSAQMQEAQKELAGDKAAMEILSDTEPRTLEEVASLMLRQGKKAMKLMLNDETVDGHLMKGVASHTGYSRKDLEKMPFLFASHDKGGMSPEGFAHELLTAAREYGVPFDEDDPNVGLTAVLNLLGSVRNQGDINNYIQNNRISQARSAHEESMRLEAEWQEQESLAKEAAERLGMNEEEWDAYISSIEAELAAQDAYYSSDDYRNNITHTDTNDNRTTGTGPAAEGAGVEGTQGQADRPDGPDAENGTETERLASDGRSSTYNGSLTEDEADDLILASAERAIPMPEFEYTSENWKKEFGDGTLETPIEQIKIGENQFAKMIDKGREKEAGLIKPTFTDPDFVIEEASEAADGTTERASSHLYVKSFIGKDGKKRYFFKSVTVKRDGLEVNISSHFDRPKRLREALKNGKLLYRFDGGAQTEQTPASVSVTTSRTNPGVSTGKVSETFETAQENAGKNEKAGTARLTGQEQSRLRELQSRGRNNLSREELDEMLLLERKERILSEGTEFDKAFALTPVSEITGADDIDANVGKLAGGLKQHEGDGTLNTFEGFAYQGAYGKNAGRQIEGYLNALSGVVPNGILEAWYERHGLSTYDDVQSYGEKLYEAAPAADSQKTAETAEGTADAIAKAEAEVDTSPTDAQKEAGNYRKGHVRIDGYDITIENPKGSERSGTDAKGNRWTSKMNNTYGYIRGTEGVDGDHIDVFLSDDPTTGDVFVVDQVNPDNGEFDEHKVMYGFPDMESAKKAYLSNYSKGWKGLGNITPVSKEEFRKWIESSHRKTKPFAEYSSVKPLGDTQAQAQTDDIGSLANDVKDAVRDYSQDMSTEKYVAWKEKESRLLAALGRLTDEELDGYAQSDNGTLRDAARKEQGRRMTIRNIDTMFNDGIKAQGDISVESKPGRFNVDVFASKDENRESMNGVYHDESGYGVASDGMVLIYDKNLYDKSNKGKSVATHKIKGRYEKGDVLQGRYPSWQKVIPHYGRKAKVDVKGLRDFLAGVAEKQKERWNASKADGGKGSLKDFTEQDNVILRLPDGSYIGMRVNALNALVSGATEMGLDELQWEGTDMSRALYFEGERGGVMAMPVNITDGVELSENGRGLYYYDMSAGASTGYKKTPVDSGMQPSSKTAADKGGEPLIKGDKWERTPAPEKNTVKDKRGHTRYDVTYTIGEGKTKYGMTKADSDMLHYILEDYNDDLRAIWNTYERGGILLPEEIASAVKAMIEYEMQSGKSAGVNSKTWRQKVDGETARVSEQEAELRDAVIGLMREEGLDVITDTETGQRVLDMANGQARLMGNRGTKKSASETAETLASKEELAYTTDISSADGAKLLKDIDNLAKSYEEKSNKPRTFLDDLALAIGAKEEGTKSKYVTIKAKNGRVFTIRLANHNTTVRQFDHKGEAEGVSIVISGTVNKGIENDGKAHIVEFFYPERSLRRAEGKPLADIVRSIEQSLYSGEYKDTTGLAQRQEVNAEQARLHKVYHGSSADFDAFDSSHIGEGEGAQSYGWGTYVTEVEGIGKTYAESGAYKNPKRQEALIQLLEAQDVELQTLRRIRGAENDLPEMRRRMEVLVEDIKENEKRRKELVREHGEDSTEVRNFDFIDGVMLQEDRAALESIDNAIEEAKRNIDEWKADLEEAKKRVMEADRHLADVEKESRILYTVEIPDETEVDYLDYTGKMGGQKDILDAVDNALAAQGWHREEIDERVRFTKGSGMIILTPNQTGADLYAELEDGFAKINALDADRRTSMFLHDCGVTGIKYPAEYRSGGRDDNARNYVVFDDGDLRITDKVRFFRTSDGEAYGFTLGGKIYIDTRIATAETPIHEYSHLWAEALRKANPEAWERLKKEMLGEKDVADYVRRLYPDITDDDELAEEVFTHYSGRRGAERLRTEQRQEMEKAQGVFAKAQVATVFGRLRDALRNFWNAARNLFAGKTDGIEKYSAEDFADMMMADLLGGFNPQRRVSDVASESETVYESKDGSKITFRSLFDETEQNTASSQQKQPKSEQKKAKEPVALENIGLRKLKKGETCLVERRYVDTGMFDFTGSEKIESSDDVAYIFRQLENAAVENSFVCLVKDGKPTVIHVGIGNYSGTIANIEQAFVAYKALKPEKVYFIHNHPSGSLRASRLDAGVLKSLYDIFGEKVAQPGIIIDTVSGKYGIYDRNATSGTMAMPEKAEAEMPVKVYSFGRQVFAPEWNPESAFTIDSSLSVAAFVSSHRLGEHEKMSFIVLDNQFHATGNFFLPYTRMDDNNWVKMADMMSEYVHQAGGVRGILYGNYGYNDADRTLLGRLSERMKQLKTPLLDVIHIDRSARDYGVVAEPQSGEDVPTGKDISLDDRLAQRRYLLSDNYVSSLTGNEFQKSDSPLTERVVKYYNDNYGGKVERESVGTVLLDGRSVKDSISHGIGRNKAIAFAAVPEIIKDGAIIDRQENWKGRGYGSVTFAAPVKIGKDGYVGVVVAKQLLEKKTGSHRFYLHEVVLQKNLLSEEFKTGMNTGSKRGDVAKLLKKIVNVKENNEKNESEAEKRDREYVEAVKAGDVNRAMDLLMDKAINSEGIVPYIAPNGYGGLHADIAKRIKTNADNAVVRAAADMSRFVPENAVLVPMPPHGGKVTKDTDTMILADAISVLTGKPVMAALEGDARESRYTAKHSGRKGVQAEDMGFRRVADIPQGKIPVIIDNVVGTGETAKAAVRAMEGGLVLSYARGKKGGSIHGLKDVAITYDDEGRLIPLSERFNEKIDDIRFREEDGERTLMGVHNISEEKLRKAIKQGGLANPSLAVINTDEATHTDYGEISLIPRSVLIDAGTGHNAGTYAGDAWTPTYPQVEKIMSDEGYDAYYADVNAVSENRSLKGELKLIWDNYLEDGSDPGKLAYWFLKERGIKTEEAIFDSGYNEEQRKRFAELTDGGKKSFFEMNENDRRGIIALMADKDGMSVEEKLSRYQAMRKRNEELLDKDDVTAFKKTVMQKQNEEIDNYGITLTPVSDFMYGMKNALLYDGKSDVKKTLQKARMKMEQDGLEKDFNRWLEEKEEKYGVKEMIFTGYTNDGDKRYVPNTLENASRIMNKEDDVNFRGQTGFGASRAMLLGKMYSLEDIRNHKDKLKGFDDDIDQRYQEASDEMFRVVNVLSDMQKISDNPFSNVDYANMRLNEALQKKDPIDYLNREYGYGIKKDGDFAKGLRNMLQTMEELPVKYFETKFKRPVSLNEFAVAIVPENTSVDVIEALRKAGLDVRTYDNSGKRAENIANRREATMSAVRNREDILFRVREDAAPRKTGTGYKVFFLSDGKLYPPMVANPGGKDTPTGVWLDADDAPVVTKSKKGRDKVKAGGKGTQGGSGTLAHRPGWHLGEIPYALQFNRGEKVDNPLGIRNKKGEVIKVGKYFPRDFVWAEVEYADDKNYQKEAESYGYNEAGNFQHSLAGLPYLPTDGSYKYRTNANPATDPWIITGAMKVTRILKPSEVDEMVRAAGREPQLREEGAVTDGQVEALNEQLGLSKADTTVEEAKERKAEELADKLGVKVRIVKDTEELTDSDGTLQRRKRKSKGWYSPRTGETVIVLPNNRDVADVEATMLHEVVAHKGLRDLLGKDFDTFLDNVYNNVTEDIRRKIATLAIRKYGYDLRVATEEYLASLAENTDFENIRKEGWWQTIKDLFMDLLRKAGIRLSKPIGDNELRYILWRSYNRLENRGIFGEAENVVMENRLMERSGEEEEAEKLSVAQAKSHLEQMRKKYKHLDNIEIVDGAKMTPEELASIFDYQIIDDAERKEIKDYLSDEHSLGNYDKITGKIVIFANKHSNLHELEGTVFHEGFHRYSNEIDNKLADFFWANKEHFPNTMKRLELLGYTKDEYAEELAAFRIEAMLNDAKWKTADEIFQGDNKKLIENYLDYIGYDRAGEEEIRRKWIDGTRDRRNRERVRGRVIQGISRNSAKNGTQRESEQDVKRLQIGSTETSENVAEENAENREEIEKNLSSLAKYVVFRDEEETEDIWKAPNMGLQERFTTALIRLASKHQDSRILRNDAMRAIGGNLAELRQAMTLQKEFDKTTVKRVADLARVLISSGYLKTLSGDDVKRLLSAVKNSVGRNDISGSIMKVLDIMIDNHLRTCENVLIDIERIKGSKLDARGIEVQGQLDPDGAHIMKVFKEARLWDKQMIEERLAEAQQRIGSNDVTISNDGTLDYAGLQFALEYAEKIKDSKLEESDLRTEIKNAHNLTDESDRLASSYRQYIMSLKDAIRQNKIERAQDYLNLVARLTNGMRDSFANVKAFKEAERNRIRDIQHNANSDMEGRPSNEHYKPKFADKFVNNPFVSFAFAPLATFDQMMRMFGSKSVNGEGYLYNRFVRSWVNARQKEIMGVRGKYAILDAKAAEIFGGKVRTWGDLIRMVGNLPKGTVSFWNGGDMQKYEMTQGNLMYIYMVDKMLDGRMKLRKMGITDGNIAAIKQVLDPRLIKLADWLQKDFLVQTRNEYNETHKRMFGASMAAVENYFPLKILPNARVDKPEELDNPDKNEGISTSTGSIIKRRRNSLALDIMNADALNVILDHVAQMEHWNAFAEFNRDLNTLRTYRHFRNQVENMTSIYGSGKELWRKFNETCQMATGAYRPPRAKLDEYAVNIAKGVTAAKVSFRIFTALKQFLSMPAYIPEARADYLLMDIANPAEAWKWSMDNLPIFNERWKSRMIGDPRLLKSDIDWKMWRNRIVNIASRVGMSPNAFVDAMTVSIGAHAIYKTRLAQYLHDGYNQADAEKRAIQDAEVLYNETQQSSEGAFLSTIQVDRSWLSVIFTVFRNSSMAYTRQLHDALRNLSHNLKKGGRSSSIEFMKKQYVRDGLDESMAEEAAKRKFYRQIRKDLLRVAVFGYIIELAWNLGSYLPYLLFGDDDDEKDKMWNDAFTHSMFGGLEGLTGGDVISQGGNMLLSGEGNPAYLNKDMPLTSDLLNVLRKYGSGNNTEALNDMINLIVQAGIGVNPQSITDAVIAIMDACGNDTVLANEATICVSRILQVPQSQIDKIYFDEVGLSGDEVSKYTPAQLARRYAEFKVKRGHFFSPWTWNDEEQLGKFTKKADKIIKERALRAADKKVNEAYLQYEDIYKTVDAKIKDTKNAGNYIEQAEKLAAISKDNDYKIYNTFKTLNKEYTDIVKKYLDSQSEDEALLCRKAIVDCKTLMIDILEAKDEKQRKKAMKNYDDRLNSFIKQYDEIRAYDEGGASGTQ